MRGKVHHRVDTAQSGRKSACVRNVAADQFESAGQKRVAGRKIVIDHNLVAPPPQRASRMTSNVTSASDDKNDQRVSPLFSRISAVTCGDSRAEMLQSNGWVRFSPNNCDLL
jgi:hypothetical protein